MVLPPASRSLVLRTAGSFRGKLIAVWGILAVLLVLTLSGCVSGDHAVRPSRATWLDRLRELGIQVETVDDPILGPSTLIIRLFPEHVEKEGTLRQDVYAALQQVSHGVLSVAHTQFGDAGAAQCVGLLAVKGFDLTRTRLTGIGLHRLAQRGDVKLLKLAGCRLSDADLACLPRLKSLRLLYLNGCPITDRALSVISQLSELRALKLNGTAVTAAGISQLTALRRLEYLDLSDTQVDDSALNSLSRLPQLRFLDLRRSRVSRRQILEFAKAAPRCQVLYAPPVQADPSAAQATEKKKPSVPQIDSSK